MSTPLTIGSRVRATGNILVVWQRKHEKTGVIVGESPNKECWLVRFDGSTNQKPTRLHKSHLEPEAAER